MDKKALTESDIRSKFIDPAIICKGWTEDMIRREYYFTDGRVLFAGSHHDRKEGKKADYLLFDEHIFCADGPYYNKLIDDRKIPKKVLEKLDLDPMNNGAPQFNYGLFLTYNRECVPGLGSYIFIHCMGEYDYTLGCIAVSEKNMIKILQHVDNNVRVCIYPA